MQAEWSMSPLMLFLGQAVVVIGLPYVVWSRPSVRKHIPLVVIQILAGVALGPSMLGGLAPELWGQLFPPASMEHLTSLSWMAVLFFAFLTGVHFDLAEIRGSSEGFAVTALASALIPSLLGLAAGWWLADAEPAGVGPEGSRLTFAFGLGVAAGVTALPVLGAILQEMGLTRSRLGVMALGCAAINDLVLWVLVAGVLALAHGGSAIGLLGVVGGAVAYAVVMGLLGRPMLTRLLERTAPDGRVHRGQAVVLVTLLLLSAMATEMIGIHSVIGAFAFGAILPKQVAQDILAKFEPFVTLILLPFFFISVGLQTDFDLTSEAVVVIFLVMTATSSAGKLLGTALVARFYGTSWREALALGSFMQCKGLMEIVVLTVLLEAGLISGAAFSAMILGAVATTAATKPLVRLFLGKEPQ